MDKFGIGPDLIIDYLALMGDKVDNIPGVPGVGEKTALAMLQGLGSIDSLYENLDKIADLGFRGSKTMAKKLEEHQAQLKLSYELATIKLDCEVEQDLEQFKIAEMDKDRLIELYGQCEFKRWLAELLDGQSQADIVDVEAEGSAPAAAQVDTQYETILTRAQLDDWVTKLKAAQLIAFDTETTSVNYMQADLVGMSFAVAPGEAAYLPINHDYVGAPEQLSQDIVFEIMAPLLADPQIKKSGSKFKI